MEKFIVIISGETNDVIKINFEKSEQYMSGWYKLYLIRLILEIKDS